MMVDYNGIDERYCNCFFESVIITLIKDWGDQWWVRKTILNFLRAPLWRAIIIVRIWWQWRGQSILSNWKACWGILWLILISTVTAFSLLRRLRLTSWIQSSLNKLIYNRLNLRLSTGQDYMGLAIFLPKKGIETNVVFVSIPFLMVKSNRLSVLGKSQTSVTFF